jgi:outer membrane protein assembly factor BamB
MVAVRWLPFLSLTLAVASCGEEPDPSSTFPSELPPTPADTWPQYRLDARHQGSSAPKAHIEPDLVLAWRSGPYGIGNYSASKSSPAVDPGRVYVGVDTGELLALDRRDGTIAWRFATRRYDVERVTTDSAHLGIHGSPAVDDLNVYIGDYSGWLYAVDRVAGTKVWESELGGSIGASPVLLGEFLFIAVEYPVPDGKIFILRAKTGEVVWSSPSLGQHPHSSVSIDPALGLLYVGANNGILFCFDYVHGRQRWMYQTGGAIKSTVAVGDEGVYVTSWDGHLYGFDGATGEKRLDVAWAAASSSSPSLHDDAVIVGSDDGVVRATDRRDGRVLWAFRTQDGVASSPTIIEDGALVAVGSRDGTLYLLDLATGTLRRAIALGAAITSVPVAVGDMLFVNDDAGTVHAFRSASGGVGP